MFVIGIILKPHGIRGEVKVEPITPDPGRFKKLKRVFLDHSIEHEKVLEKVRVAGSFVFLKFSGTDDRNGAEQLRGREICIEQSDLIALPDDTFFVHDLIGCRVEAENGSHIGDVKDILQSESNDVYVVHDGAGNEFLIPGIHDVIKQIDVKKQTIVIHVIDGLLD